MYILFSLIEGKIISLQWQARDENEVRSILEKEIMILKSQGFCEKDKMTLQKEDVSYTFQVHTLH